MQSKRPAAKTSSGDIFSTYLDTVRGDSQVETTPLLSVLRLLKVAGPQPLEKVVKIFGSESPSLMDNLLKAAEDEIVIIGDDPKFPGDTVVTITQRGLDLLATIKQQKN